MRLILITGMSGSGKSIALNVLEDSGFYCVDNLPANLLAGLIDFLGQTGYAKVAVSVDVRIRKVVLPVAAGRNLAVLVEAAVRNYVLQLRGIDSTQDFIRRQEQHFGREP